MKQLLCALCLVVAASASKAAEPGYAGLTIGQNRDEAVSVISAIDPSATTDSNDVLIHEGAGSDILVRFGSFDGSQVVVMVLVTFPKHQYLRLSRALTEKHGLPATTLQFDRGLVWSKGITKIQLTNGHGIKGEALGFIHYPYLQAKGKLEVSATKDKLN